MNDLISIIVPVYNVSAYLRKCVESLVNQTYERIEIILVDDGSTDNSGVLCDEWEKADSRIVVIHKENGGLSDARNAGIQLVWCKRGRLQKQKTKMQDYCRSIRRESPSGNV